MTYPHPEDERYDDIGLESVCSDCGALRRHLPWCKTLESDEETLPADPEDTDEDEDEWPDEDPDSREPIDGTG